MHPTSVFSITKQMSSGAVTSQGFFYLPLDVFEHIRVLDGWSDLCGKTVSLYFYWQSITKLI